MTNVFSSWHISGWRKGITTLAVSMHQGVDGHSGAAKPSNSKRIEAMGRFMDLVAEVDKEPAPARS